MKITIHMWICIWWWFVYDIYFAISIEFCIFGMFTLTRWTVRGLSDKWLLIENLRAKQSVCVACAFIALRLIFSINTDSDCCWMGWMGWMIGMDCGMLANGNIAFIWSLCGCCCISAWWWWCWWCNWWWCKCSGELDTFLPPIKRSWLFAVFKRVAERLTHTSSNDVNVCERAKLTCFVLRKKI